MNTHNVDLHTLFVRYFNLKRFFCLPVFFFLPQQVSGETYDENIRGELLNFENNYTEATDSDCCQVRIFSYC